MKLWRGQTRHRPCECGEDRERGGGAVAGPELRLSLLLPWWGIVGKASSMPMRDRTV